VSIALAMIVKDEEEFLPAAVESAASVVDALYVLDTGSTDDTLNLAFDVVERVGDGGVLEVDWDGFAAARTQALEMAREHDWVLMLDADMRVEAHEDLKEWLEADPDPEVDAWQVEISQPGLRWRLPRLTRGGLDWRYVGRAHEYLDPAGRKQRPLLGLTLHHERGDRTDRAWLLEQLMPDVEKGDPRATYYAAQSLWCLGRTDDAVEMYSRRAAMGGWEEERWHADYMRARLSENVELLLAVHRRRWHRPEPLLAAARILAKHGPGDDVLFVEPIPD
jgi:glycosyltransferase involved in cell wall biosynthesis